jgi:hypothetical protein
MIVRLADVVELVVVMNDTQPQLLRSIPLSRLSTSRSILSNCVFTMIARTAPTSDSAEQHQNVHRDHGTADERSDREKA